jgi:hypothetical protein
MVCVDIVLLNNLFSLFFANYIINYINDSPNIDLYSDLDPSNSKHILDALHNLLNDLNLKGLVSSKYASFGKGDGGPDPDFSPYMYLFLELDDNEPRLFEKIS